MKHSVTLKTLFSKKGLGQFRLAKQLQIF